MSADLTIIGDIHLGVERVSHTTPAGRERLRQKIFDRATDIVRRAEGYVVQAGDLFDKVRNSDVTLYQGTVLVPKLDAVLAGNHDVFNRSEALSTLQMVDQVVNAFSKGSAEGGRTEWSPETREPWIAFPYYDGEPIAEVFYTWDNSHVDLGSLIVFGVPYQPTQAAFLKALQDAVDVGKDDRPACQVLVLHCNYDLTFAKDDPLTNNLSPEKAEELLEVFDYIFCGHEHNPRVLHNGRLIMTGSIMPLSFAEMTDKFIWHVENGEITRELIWSVDQHYRCFGAAEAPDVLDEALEFIKITGTVSASEYADLLRKVQAWWQESPNLLAVNISEVQVEGLVAPSGGDEIFQPMAVRPLAESMEALLQDSGLLELWRQIYAEMT